MKFMVKVSIWMLAFFLLIPLLPLEAAETPQVQINIIGEEFTTGDFIDVTVSLNNFIDSNGDVSGFQVALQYDPEILEAQTTKVNLGSIFSGIRTTQYSLGTNTVKDGKVFFGASFYQQTTPFTGSGTLFTISFRLKTDSSFDIQLLDDETMFIQKGKPGVPMVGIELIDYVYEVQEGEPALNNPDPDNPSPDNPSSDNPTLDDKSSTNFTEGISTSSSMKIEDFQDYDSIKSIPWAFAAINRLVSLGIMNGIDGSFKPEEFMTREQFAKVIVLALQIEKTTEAPVAFEDVSGNSWSKDYIDVAAKYNLIKGKLVNGKLVFDRTAPITRAQIASILVRSMNLQDRELGELKYEFKDIDTNWAKKDILIAFQEGLLKGRGIDRFNPEEPATRAEVAVIITRLLDYRPYEN